jgi:hypothetical protein
MRHLRAALWVFGAVGLGFQFPEYAMKQFKNNVPWDVGSSLPGWLDPENRIAGGHYVAAIGVAKNGNIICVSWGREQEMTPKFYVKYADEVYAYLDLDRLSKSDKLSPQRFNEAKLRRDLEAVSEGSTWALDQDREYET